jgi:hypothetical protein
MLMVSLDALPMLAQTKAQAQAELDSLKRLLESGKRKGVSRLNLEPSPDPSVREPLGVSGKDVVKQAPVKFKSGVVMTNEAGIQETMYSDADKSNPMKKASRLRFAGPLENPTGIVAEIALLPKQSLTKQTALGAFILKSVFPDWKDAAKWLNDKVLLLQKGDVMKISDMRNDKTIEVVLVGTEKLYIDITGKDITDAGK